ncbi:hypothetical protein [Longivirga aurantiaca]|uniref:Uncharacterized protein n=1 Tax=Longivirga aurantiaca TaxID=1837743 RepID=A0ABW1T444_9ACTN
MSTLTSRGVEMTLRAWADAQRPVPSPALAQLMGPLVPLPALALPTGHLGGAATQAGLSTKVIASIAAVAVTGAAAVGISRLRSDDVEPPRPPQSVAPVVPGVEPRPDAPGPVLSTPAPMESESAEPEPAESRTAEERIGPAPTRSSTPRAQETEAADSDRDDDGDAEVRPTATRTAKDDDKDSDGPARTGSTGAEPTATASQSPAPSATATPAPTPKPSNGPQGNGPSGQHGDDHDDQD